MDQRLGECRGRCGRGGQGDRDDRLRDQSWRPADARLRTATPSGGPAAGRRAARLRPGCRAVRGRCGLAGSRAGAPAGPAAARADQRQQSRPVLQLVPARGCPPWRRRGDVDPADAQGGGQEIPVRSAPGVHRRVLRRRRHGRGDAGGLPSGVRRRRRGGRNAGGCGADADAGPAAHAAGQPAAAPALPRRQRPRRGAAAR